MGTRLGLHNKRGDLDTMPGRRVLYVTFMADLQFLSLQPHEFDSLPVGFEYEHEISEASNTIAFDTGLDDRDLRRCVVCGMRAAGGPHPSVARAHVIGQTEDILVGDFLLF
jgi:hypothetical protein